MILYCINLSKWTFYYLYIQSEAFILKVKIIFRAGNLQYFWSGFGFSLRIRHKKTGLIR